MNEGEVINKTETPTTETPAKKTFAEILRDAEPKRENAQPDNGTDGKAAEKQKKAKPKSLKDLAEKLELEDKDLYAIEVPMSNGESRTLGQLKDEIAKQEDFTAREVEFLRTRTKREQEDIRAERQLEELLANLPAKALSEKTLGLVRERTKQKLARVQQVIAEVPEWQNDKERQVKDIAAMKDYAETFGLPEYFLADLEHPGLFKLVKSAWELAERVDASLAQVKQGPPATTTSKPNKSAPKKSSPAPQVRKQGDSRSQRIDDYRQKLAAANKSGE